MKALRTVFSGAGPAMPALTLRNRQLKETPAFPEKGIKQVSLCLCFIAQYL